MVALRPSSPVILGWAALTLLRDLDRVTKLAGLAVDLDAVVKELLEGRGVEDVVVHGDRVVNVELVQGLARVLGGGSGLGLPERVSTDESGERENVSRTRMAMTMQAALDLRRTMSTGDFCKTMVGKLCGEKRSWLDLKSKLVGN